MYEIEKAIKYIEENPLGDRNLAANKEYSLNRVRDGKYFHFCKECGMIEFSTYTHKDKLMQGQLCFSCDLWIDRANNIKPKHLIVKRGEELTFYSDAGASSCLKRTLGFGGAHWEYKMLINPDEVITTNNMWHGGTIPKHLYYLFPINAEILN